MKRSQAALEFVATYGWAIIGILAVIGVLSYFGVFSIGKYTPQSCIFDAELTCRNYQNFYDSTKDRTYSSVLLTGRGGELITYNATATTFDGDVKSDGCFLASRNGNKKEVIMKVLPDDTFRLYCYFDGELGVQGEDFRARIKIWAEPERKYPFIINGEVRAKMSTSLAPADP